MKLRNKKTGEIIDCKEILILREDSEGIWQAGQGSSLAELNEEWEDYKPAEPLIKDEKIRKAVRAWADATNRTRVDFIQGCVFEYGWASIDFGVDIDENLKSGNYTIAELCGKEEK